MPTKFRIIQTMIFPRSACPQKLDFEEYWWVWTSVLKRIPIIRWAAKKNKWIIKSNQISPELPHKNSMTRLKLLYYAYIIWRAKVLIPWKSERKDQMEYGSSWRGSLSLVTKSQIVFGSSSNDLITYYLIKTTHVQLEVDISALSWGQTSLCWS